MERAVFTVQRFGDAWAVECDGETFGHAADKEEAKAWAAKRARAVIDGGGGAVVRIMGENGAQLR